MPEVVRVKGEKDGITGAYEQLRFPLSQVDVE